MTDERDLRPDHEMDGRVNTWLTDTDLTPDEANAGLERLLQDFPVTPQARRRLLGRWLDRDEGVGRHTLGHKPPSKTNRRTRLMFSATGIVAALAILALSVSVMDTNLSPPGAAAADHVVAADGSGDFTTIGAAVEAAAPGDSIAIKPGTYDETPSIEKSIELLGSGERDQVVIVLAADEEMLLKAPNVVIRDLTITGESSGGVLASGGAPVVENVHFMSVGLPYQGGSSCSSPCNSLEFLDGAIGVVRDSDFTGGGEIGVDGGASAVIEANRLSGGPHIALFEVGEGTVVRGNAITGTVARGIGTFGDTTPLIEGNQLSAPGPVGIDLWEGSPIVRDNVITEATTGINVKRETGSVALLANDLTQNGSGITWWGGTDGVIDGNTISEGISGLVINGGSPTVTGNSVCGNTSNLTVSSTADLVDDGTNDICEDAPPQ